MRFATLVNHLGPTWRHAIVAMDGATAARDRLAPSLDVIFPKIKVEKGKLLRNVHRFRHAIRTLAPQAMLTHNFGSLEWAIANRVSIVHHLHVEDGFGPEERTRQLPRRVWLRRLFLRSRPVVLPSRTLLQIATKTWQLKPNDLHYVPNGVDLSRFAGPIKSPGWPGTGPIIGTVAALRPEKNVGRLIRSFALSRGNSPSRLVIVGDGPQRTELEALASSLGVAPHVSFLGHIADPAPFIRSFDIFALSSDTEQMPLSLLEAMAAGLPTAATDVGDVALMLPMSNRRFVTARDDERLAIAIGELVERPDLRHELGRAARERAIAEFDQSTMLARWSALLDGSCSATPIRHDPAIAT